MEKFFPDTGLSGRLKVSQPKTGYRFAQDPFLLAAQVSLDKIQRVLDIGCGCGIISLLLARRSPELFITGIEIQEELYEYARANVQNNKLDAQITIFHQDINQSGTAIPEGGFDLVISNPPYKKKGTGRINPNLQKAIAHHEIHLDLDQLFTAAHHMLHRNGKVALIFPADRTNDLKSASTEHGFGPETIQYIHTKKNSPASRVIFCAAKTLQQPCVILPPIYL